MTINGNNSILTRINELTAAKAKVSALEKALLDERQKRLRELPSEFGFQNVEEFISEVRNVHRLNGAPSLRRRPARPAQNQQNGQSRKARTPITDEIKDRVVALVHEGKTGAEIATAVGISPASVQNIKKERGLVNATAAAA